MSAAMPRRVMLVMGGSGSIGSAIVDAAVAAGWAVALHGRRALPAGEAVMQLRERHGAEAPVVSIAGDIEEPGAVEDIVSRAGGWFGRIDAVVDCVSTGPKARLTGAFAETEPAAYSGLMDLSVVHFQRLAQAALPWLQREGGTLIAFSSDAGRYAAPRQALIGASRAAIIGFVRNLATEVAREGVRVHCLSPSYVQGSASMKKLRAQNRERADALRQKAGLGLPTPEDIAPMALFLCGEGAKRITGQVISINGGANA